MAGASSRESRMNQFNKGEQMTPRRTLSNGVVRPWTSVMLTVYNYREVSNAFGTEPPLVEPFEGLELYDGKLSRTVLRRGLGCKAQLLSGLVNSLSNFLT